MKKENLIDGIDLVGKTVSKVQVFKSGDDVESPVIIDFADETEIALYHRSEKADDIEAEIKSLIINLWDKDSGPDYDKSKWKRLLGLLQKRGLNI